MIANPSQFNARRSQDGVEFSFREVRTAHEMRDALALRYRVYSASPGTSHHRSLDRVSGLDADAHDLTSRHFALFARAAGRSSVIGTLRLTSRETSPQLALLHAVASAHSRIAERFAGPGADSLPMLCYLASATALRDYVERVTLRGERTVEAGRFAIDPRVLLGVGRSGIRLSAHVLLSAIAFATRIRPVDRVLITCEPHLERLYRAVGFSRVAALPTVRAATADVRFVVLEATPADVPPGVRPLIAELAGQFAATGESVLRPAAQALPLEPHCNGTDALACPRRARPGERPGPGGDRVEAVA